MIAGWQFSIGALPARSSLLDSTVADGNPATNRRGLHVVENKAKKFIFLLGTAPGQDGKDAKQAKKAIFLGGFCVPSRLSDTFSAVTLSCSASDWKWSAMLFR